MNRCILQLVKIAGTDKVSAVATSLVRSGARVGLGIAVARMSDTDSFACFVLLIGIETIVSTLMNACITMPLITVASGASPDEACRLRTAAYRGCRVLTLISVPPALAFAWGMTRPTPDVLIAFSVFLAASLLALPRLAELTACFRSRRILASEVAFGIGMTIILVSLYFTDFAQKSGPWIALSVGALMRWAVLGHSTHDRNQPCSSQSVERLKAVAIPMVVGSAGVAVSSRIQPFVLQAMLGAAHVGSFGVAQTMVGPIRIFSSSFSGVLRPRLALHARRGDLAAFRSSFLQALVPIVSCGGFLALCAVIGGDAVASMVFGSSFVNVGACLAALSIYAVLEAIGACSAVAVQSLSDDGSRIVTRNRLTVAALGLLLLLPAAYWGGAVGSAWALAAAEGLFVALMLNRMRFALRECSHTHDCVQLR